MISYGALDIDSHIGTKKYTYIGARFHGFFRPPYTGYFNILIMTDDYGEILISHGQNNMSSTAMVSFMFSSLCECLSSIISKYLMS